MKTSDSTPSGPGSRADGSTGHAAEDRRSAAEGVTLVEIGNILLRHRRALVTLPLAFAVGVVLVSILLPRTYTSTTSLTPQGTSQGQLARVSGLAAQFGIDIPGGGQGGESPRFYADLLRSRALLSDVVETEYRLEAAGPEPDDRAGTLVDLYEIEARSPELARTIAVDRLEDQIEVATVAETGVVELSVTSSEAELSRQIADRMIELLNEFNRETRRSRAGAERRFLGQRLEAAREDLTTVEDSLERFLERNRRYQNSPHLRFEQQRLQRRVDLQQQLVTSLAQSYEQARIEEVRDTPVITVVAPPEAPPRPDSRQLPIRAVLGLMVGGTISLVWSFGAELAARVREEEPGQFAEFNSHLQEALSELRGLWSRFRSLFAGDR